MTIDDLEQATAHNPQPMHRSGMWTTLFVSPSPTTAIAFTGQTFSHFSQATHVSFVKRGMKWGGAMLPGQHGGKPVTVLTAYEGVGAVLTVLLSCLTQPDGRLLLAWVPVLSCVAAAQLVAKLGVAALRPLPPAARTRRAGRAPSARRDRGAG